MKKIGFIGLFCILCFLSSYIPLVYADDGGPITSFWLMHEKIICVSVTNPDFYGDELFLVYDYSPEVGKKLGRPWSFVEAGKCYEADEDGGTLYFVKKVTGNEWTTLANYPEYSPEASIKDANIDKSAVVGFWGDPDTYYGISGSRYKDLYFTGLHLDDLIPTKYGPSTYMTHFYSTTPDYIIAAFEDPDYLKYAGLINKLVKELSIELQKCDRRSRIEYRFTFTDSRHDWPYEHVVWGFADGRNILLPKSWVFKDYLFGSEPFQVITLLGCRDTYVRFLKAHQADFAKADEAAESLLAKYDANNIKNIYELVAPRTQEAIDAINSYLVSSVPVELELVTKSAKTSVANPPAPSVDVPVNEEEPMAKRVGVGLDPMPDEKAELYFGSARVFMKVYLVLPVIAFFGMGVILVVRNFKKK